MCASLIGVNARRKSYISIKIIVCVYIVVIPSKINKKMYYAGEIEIINIYCVE